MKKLSLAVALALGGLAQAEPTRTYTFSMLKAPAVDTLRAKAEAWTKDPAVRDKAAKIWADADRSSFDRLVEVIALSHPEAAAALADARDPAKPAPKELPAFLKNATVDPFVKANVALAYARALSGKRVFEEALEALKSATPELVADPASYYFHKAVAEHALVQKSPALMSITRLLEDVSDVPERYKNVSILMLLEMQSWKDEDKDLENIARLMDNIERRLDLARGGPKTQEIQKKVINRLDEVIKEVENQIKNGQSQCPSGGQPGQGGSNQPSAPQNDSFGGNNGGPGVVDSKKLKNLAENWGKLPEKERAKAMMEITKDLPPRYREVIENYFKTLAKSQNP
ncbi:MAG: hypothetical protein K1X57_03100 [Gemmataceae bacterium]|nr:hypothetical protein [Gemmataceae bacterium]